MKQFVAAVLFLFPFSLTFAQTFQGSLRGRVSDPGGAPAQSVKVTLTDEATTVSRSTLSNEQGEYVFTSVTPAIYSVVAELTGFKRVDQKGVQISTQAAVTLDIALELGQVNETVDVVADTPLLQTADASTGQLVDRQKITDLPILGRNPFFVGKLAQAVVYVANPKFARMQDQNGNSQVSIAGGPLRTNNYLVDGISITDSNNRAVILPSPEAVQELKVQVSTYDAEVGRSGGGAFNTLLNSGTNELHGSAVGHIRETDWLANNFFANRAGQAIADQPFRDWAFSLGGPIVIPKVYNGKNKTFFFASDESYRQQDGSTTVLAVPTALERAGNFSQSFTKSGALQAIYDPNSTNLTTGARSPYPNNIIPASQLNPIGTTIASYYPLPNGPTSSYAATNYSFTGSYPNRGDQRVFKLDHEFASWIRASASYIHQKTFETDSPTNVFPQSAATPGQSLCCDRKIDSTQANATLTPNPTTVVAIRWGFNRFYSRTTQNSAGFDITTLGFPASVAALSPGNPAFPGIAMGSAVSGCSYPTANVDFASFGGGCANQDVFYSRSFNTTVSKFLGKHSVKAGFDFRTLHDLGTPATGPSSFGFTDVFTRKTPQSATAGTGSDLATLLLGFPTSGQATIVTNFDDFIRYYGGFVQDDYRVTPKLTLNFGIRFEYESGIQEKSNKLIVGFDKSTASPLQIPGLNVLGGVEYAGVNGNPTQTGNAASIKPGPRFGFAYAADSKTVVRGGYGIFWAPTFFSFQNAIGYSQTTTINASLNNNFTPNVTLANPYPNGLLQPTGNSLGLLSGIGQGITVYDPRTESAGYVQQYSLEVQRQAPGGFVFTAGALGSHALHLLVSGDNVNQLNPTSFALAQTLPSSVANPFYGHGGVGSIGNPTISPIQLLEPFPQFSSVQLSNSNAGASRYYSFYFRAQRRYANGLNLLASFTWSRSMDNITGLNTAGALQVAAVSGPQNAYNLNGEFSLSTQDAPNRFSTAISYELPFGHGKKFLSGSRVLDLVAGGWSVNTFGVIQSGYPLSITQANNNSIFGAAYQRPNATGISPETSGSTDQRINGWLNPAAFSLASAYTFGNTSRFLDVRGPSLFNFDVSIFKSFSIRERIKAQFRAEALNATNTVYFGNPNTSYSPTSSTFGVITSQINNPRMIQLGARVTF